MRRQKHKGVALLYMLAFMVLLGTLTTIFVATLSRTRPTSKPNEGVCMHSTWLRPAWPKPPASSPRAEGVTRARNERHSARGPSR